MSIEGTGYYTISSGFPVDYEVLENGRVLVIRDALFDPLKLRYHTIRLEKKGWSVLGFDLGGGGKFEGITEEIAQQIQTTYGIVLKTLNSRPGEILFCNREGSTSFELGARGWFNWPFFKQRMTSYPQGQSTNDVYLSKQDAMKFGSQSLTLHDAVRQGISSVCIKKFWPRNEVSNQDPGSKKDSDSPRKVMENSQEDLDLPKNRLFSKKDSPLLSSFPSIPVYKPSSTPIEPGFDSAAFTERKRRIVAHLDRSSPIPFSAFSTGNLDRKIAPALFRRMLDALRILSLDPSSKNSDACYMKRLLKHWFRSAYHYLDKNSTPGEGYAAILEKVLETFRDKTKAEEKARELYWRRHATFFWMCLTDLFSKEKIDIDLLHKEISDKTNISFLFYK